MSGGWVYNEDRDQLEHIDGTALDWMAAGSVGSFADLVSAVVAAARIEALETDLAATTASLAMVNDVASAAINRLTTNGLAPGEFAASPAELPDPENVERQTPGGQWWPVVASDRCRYICRPARSSRPVPATEEHSHE